ncbi:hypothetical protein E2542_SST29971 [Spatholobus suberectus]|nr:hypothetical protein E2542_SST29971 [Spatholobus suberectus]
MGLPGTEEEALGANLDLEESTVLLAAYCGGTLNRKLGTTPLRVCHSELSGFVQALLSLDCAGWFFIKMQSCKCFLISVVSGLCQELEAKSYASKTSNRTGI